MKVRAERARITEHSLMGRRRLERDESYEDYKRRRESSRHRKNACRDERARRRSKENKERVEQLRSDRYRHKHYDKQYEYKEKVSILFDFFKSLEKKVG